MKVSNQKNSLARPQSPTLSDGSHPKRPHLGSDDYDPDEKFEKVRRIDSPTETSPRLGMQFSPQIGTLSLSGKGSPTANPNKRSVSPKALYPPSIQKFLNGKSTLTIEEAIDKLKTPSNKTHKGQLEKMKMLGAFQKQEVASNVAFRKAYTNSPTSVSPARSTSPVGSPMVVSPRHENMFQESENITYTFDDEGDSAMQGGLLGAMGKMNFPKQNVDNWLSNMGIQGGNNGMFQQQQQDNGRSHGNMPMNQGNNNNNNNNFGGNNNNQRSGPFNQFGQQQPNNNKQYQSLTPQALAFLNSQSQDTGNYRDRDRGAQYDDDEPRDRTNSFLRLPRDLAAPADTNYRSLADTQLNAIQSIMRATRAISPTEPNRGVMQQFQKRNSNPESIMNNHGHGAMQMQQPLFENRPSAFNQNMMQDFNTGFNGGMQQHHQYSHQQYNNNNGMQQQQGMFSMQHNQQQLHMDNGYNNQNNMMKKEYAPQQQQQQQYNSGYGGYGQPVNNMPMQGHESKNYHDQMAWNMPNHQINGDPEAFLFEKNETEDFDLNIIPSDLNFMPNRQMEELADPNDNHLIVPDPTGMDQFFNNPHGMFRFNQ